MSASKCSLSFDRGGVDEVEEGGVKVFYDRIFLNNRYFCRRESPLRCNGGRERTRITEVNSNIIIDKRCTIGTSGLKEAFLRSRSNILLSRQLLPLKRTLHT